ncbi:MAG: CDGSH iron-sulfur domain-containing protein [Emcibacteraceae bacterium]|nr:CDGSH iron-sulfur domain-containing protein [Emcibacteraceae bacterium]
MSDWQDVPFIVNVTAGETKAFCMCGLSSNAPFCDGTHK